MRLPPMLLLAASLVATGCVSRPCRPCTPPQPCGVVTRTAPPVETELPHRLYDGVTGRPTTLAAFLAKARRADVVAFGELHGHPVGAAYELAVLQGLAGSGRPLATAMEFFERDHQDALKAYLARKMDEETFRKTTKRTDDYAETHGPLIEYCRERGLYVIGANVPRRLVKQYRKSDLDYAAWVASLEPEERRFVPRRTTVLKDAYWERFHTQMGGMPEAMTTAFFKSQSLWDDAMAEAMADFRTANPRHRLLFVVGGFHVTDGLGTITKYLERRPRDRVAILVMDAVGADDEIVFEDEQRGSAHAVLMVKMPKRKPSSTPNPHARPKKPKAEEAPDAEEASEADEAEGGEEPERVEGDEEEAAEGTEEETEEGAGSSS